MWRTSRRGRTWRKRRCTEWRSYHPVGSVGGVSPLEPVEVSGESGAMAAVVREGKDEGKRQRKGEGEGEGSCEERKYW